ncbi:MAG: transposase [Bacteroidetes bacterium]|nr:transposase [Bacteroidota bacterium]
MKDFSGVLQTDGYAAYNGLRLKGHILPCRMAHARRNFERHWITTANGLKLPCCL